MKICKYTLLVIVAFIIQTAPLLANETTVKQYKIDDAVVENLFQSSDDITFALDEASFMLPAQEKVKGSDKQMVAGIIALGSYVLGIGWLIPIHRLVLGTGNETAKIIVLYCVTFSGCGLLLLADGIMLLIDSEGSQYIENPKFIMWND